MKKRAIVSLICALACVALIVWFFIWNSQARNVITWEYPSQLQEGETQYGFTIDTGLLFIGWGNSNNPAKDTGGKFPIPLPIFILPLLPAAICFRYYQKNKALANGAGFPVRKICVHCGTDITGRTGKCPHCTHDIEPRIPYEK